MSEIESASDNPKTKYLSLCSSLANSDLFQIWNGVSSYIQKNLLNQKGVTIHNLGIFSFEQNKLDVGGNKYLLIQRPIFQLSEKFCQTHGLKQTKHTLNGSIPAPPLNFSALTQECGYDRDTIETSVRELISILNRSVAGQQTVEFTFQLVGRLHIRGGFAKFKFYKDLITSLENGGKIVETMQNRPGTADSIMSDRPASRAFHVSLPYNGANSAKTKMETIPEDDIFTDNTPMEHHNHEDAEHVGAEEQALNQLSKDTARSSMSSRISSRGPHRIPIPVSMVSDFEFPEIPSSGSGAKVNGIPQLLPSSHEDDRQVVHFHSTSSNDDDHEERNHKEISNDHNSESSSVVVPPLDVVHTERSDNTVTTDNRLRPPLNHRLGLGRSKSTLTPIAATLERPLSRASSCGHPASAGQELCYLCHQRARRNIPISFVEEIKQRDAEEDELIQTYQQMKDTEYIMKEQEKLLARRHDAQKMSAFNLGVSEAVKQKTHFRDPHFYPSYIMKQRPLTPPKYIKQQQLKTDLSVQMDLKKSVVNKERADKALLEKLEQIQLAEDLAVQRQKYLEDKLKRQKQYVEALDVQVRNKPDQMPERASDSEEPMFGKNDLNEEKLLERRRKAQELLREQEAEVMRKKREEILRKIQNQKYEEEVLKRSKMDLLRDRAMRYQRYVEDRQGLETEWMKAAQEKRERELLHHLRASTPGGLIHEQCDKYKRCAQCRRKLNNVGETNIWCESYYVPGSRYIC